MEKLILDIGIWYKLVIDNIYFRFLLWVYYSSWIGLALCARSKGSFSSFSGHACWLYCALQLVQKIIWCLPIFIMIERGDLIWLYVYIVWMTFPQKNWAIKAKVNYKKKITLNKIILISSRILLNPFTPIYESYIKCGFLEMEHAWMVRLLSRCNPHWRLVPARRKPRGRSTTYKDTRIETL